MRIIYLLLAFGTILGCSPKTGGDSASQEEVVDYAFFGDKIDTAAPVSVSAIADRIVGNDSIKVNAKGVVEEVCQMKGCWMTVKMENGETMRVTFKDYGFFVPKDISGTEVIIDGYAYQSLTDVETQKHYAQDAGNTIEEIEAITNPKNEITFIADGVALPN